MQKTSVLIFVLFFTLFSSCRKEFGKPSWDTQLLAPIVTASLNIDNLLPDSLLQANADSSLKLVYHNDIYKLSSDTLFKIPDTTIHAPYTIPFAYTFNPGQVVVSNSQSETTYQLQGAQLRKTIIKSGAVKFIIKSLIHEVTDFVYSIPCAKLNGVPFTIQISVPAAVGNIPGVASQIYDLSNYEFDLTGFTHNKVNTITTSLTASVSPLGQAILVNPTDSLITDNSFSDLVPFYAKGYFGQNTFNVGPSQSEVKLFSRITDGTIQLEDVNFKLQIENPIGLDSRVYLNNFSSINSRTGTTVNLANSSIGTPININRAAESGGTVYPTYANLVFNSANSNIKALLENLPDKFGYAMQIITNPMGNVSGSNDFIYSDKLMKAIMDVEIPLSLVATNLTLVDTLNLNISNTSGIRDVHSGTVTLLANNGFPFDANMQFYLLNDANIVVDSIFEYANTIDEAPINSSLRAIGKKLTKIVVPINENKMNLIFNTKKIKLKVKFNTSANPQKIKIFSDYAIDVKLVADANYTVQLK